MRERNGFRRMVRKGFSLVELLVAIAILALMAALLSPVFTRGKEQMNIGVSITNVSQISKAIMLYAADHDDWTPRVVGDTTVAGLKRGDLPGDLPADIFDYVRGQKTLREALLPYLQSEGVWRSPNDRPIWVGDLPSLPGGLSFYDYSGSSYGFLVNDLCSGALGRIQEPSRSSWLREGAPFIRGRAVFGRADGSVQFLEWSPGSRELGLTELDFGCR